MLPWVLLSMRTAYQPDLGCTPADLVLGETPRLPGDLVDEMDFETSPGVMRDLLIGLQANADREPIPTSHHRNPAVNIPKDLDKATHVRTKIHKTGTLGHSYDGPFRILRRLGETCVEVLVGHKVDETPRTEVHHWNNVKVAVWDEDQKEATKPSRGRKRK